MKLTPKSVFCFFVYFLFIQGFCNDWNEAHYLKSLELIQCLEEFNNEAYKSHLEFLKNGADSVLTNRKLNSQIKKIGFNKKKTFFHEPLNLYIKKRAQNKINDAHFWELSFLFDLSHLVVASFPLHIQENAVIIQPFQKMTVGKKAYMLHPLSILNKVSLETYWKSLLFAYVLGLEDLKSTNIGIEPQGNLLFFDNEFSLEIGKEPTVNDQAFKVGLNTLALDWPQYQLPLDSFTLLKLKHFCEKLAAVKEKLRMYFEIRECPYSLDPIYQRLDEVVNFPLAEGLTFCNFYLSLYPKMALGLEELCQIVSRIFQKKVGHGTALYYAAYMKRSLIPIHEMENIQQWIQKYLK